MLVGCVSTNVQVDPSVEMNHGDLFYIARYDDDIGVYESIEEGFLEYGLNAESVYNAMSIPPAETPEVSGSGFYVAQDIIVTNDHVLNGESEITYYKNGIKHSAIPVFTSEQNDFQQGTSLALLFFQIWVCPYCFVFEMYSLIVF